MCYNILVIKMGSRVLFLVLVVVGISLGVTLSEEMVEKMKRTGNFAPDQLSNAKIIMDECTKRTSDKRDLAYILSTAIGESNLRPIKTPEDDPEIHESFYSTDYYGRGFILIRDYDEYEKYGMILGIDLVNRPELAMQPVIAAKIMCVAMKKGNYRGTCLDAYFNERKTDWTGARFVITSSMRNAAEYGDRARRIFDA